MNIFQRIVRWVVSLFNKQDIEDALGLVIATSDEILEAQELWRSIYEGDAPWNDDEIVNTGLAKGLCERVAKLVTVEFESSVEGSPRADYLNEQYQRVVKVHGANGFRATAERGCAGGSLVLRPFVDNTDGQIYVTAVENNCYYPIAYDAQGNLVEVVFADTVFNAETEIYYTLLEHCIFEDETYTIRYTVWESSEEDELGKRGSLSSVEEWANLPEEMTFQNVTTPWFSLFTMPQVGTEKQGAPEGSALFANAIPNLEKADKQEARTEWEFEGGELAVDASEDLFKGDGELPAGKERLFRKHNVGAEEFEMQVFNPEFRYKALAERLNDIKRDIEFNCGLSFGTISDVNLAAKTATEVMYGRADTATTVESLQSAWQITLERLVLILDEMATAYSLAPQGEYEVQFWWDDSTIQTSQEKEEMYRNELNEMIRLLDKGIIDKAVVLAFVRENSLTFEKISEEAIEAARAEFAETNAEAEEEEVEAGEGIFDGDT